MNKQDWDDNTERYVLFIDIMGQKNRINKLSHQDLIETMKRYTENTYIAKTDISENIYKTNDLLRLITFSDSFIYATKDTSEKALEVISFTAANFLKRTFFIDPYLPIKGAIARGHFSMDEENHLYVGKALVDAVEQQDALDFFGIAAHPSMESNDCPLFRNIYPYYKIPFKNGNNLESHIMFHMNDKTEIDRYLNSLTKMKESGAPDTYIENTKKVIELDYYLEFHEWYDNNQDRIRSLTKMF